MIKLHSVTLAGFVAACVPLAGHAAGDYGVKPEEKPRPAPAASAMTDAEVRKVDRENKKLTLKHGEIKNLDMPSMTMVFQVKEAALLDKVKAGDMVRFKAERIDGVFTVTAIEPAP